MIEHLVHIENVLDGATRTLGENGPQDLVSNDDVPQRGEQCIDVEIAGLRALADLLDGGREVLAAVPVALLAARVRRRWAQGIERTTFLAHALDRKSVV